MANKADKSKGGGVLSSIPLGSALDVFDGLAGLVYKLLIQRYQVTEKIEHLKEDATEKVQEIREEAIRTGFAIKKAFLKTIVEAILLSSGIICLVIGAIILVSKAVAIEYVLIGYGLVITTIVVFQLKTRS